jgi:hypothetical protein
MSFQTGRAIGLSLSRPVERPASLVLTMAPARRPACASRAGKSESRTPAYAEKALENSIRARAGKTRSITWYAYGDKSLEDSAVRVRGDGGRVQGARRLRIACGANLSSTRQSRARRTLSSTGLFRIS